MDLSFYILVGHWFQQNFKVQEDFLRLVQIGRFPPEVYADLVDIMNGSMMYKSQFGTLTEVKYSNKIKNIKRNTDDLNTINENRAEIGLPIFSEYLTNLQYFKKDRKFIYYRASLITLFGMIRQLFFSDTRR